MRAFMLIFLALFYSIGSFGSINPVNIDRTLSKVLSDIIRVFFVEQKIHFDIIVYTSYKSRIINVLNDLGMNNIGNYAETIKIVHPEFFNRRLSKSTVILFPNDDHFMYFLNHIELNGKFYSPLKFITYCKGLEIKDLNRIDTLPHFDIFGGFFSMFLYFLVDTDDGYTLAHSEWFTDHACNRVQLVHFNNFSRYWLEWVVKLESNERKFKNFHGCTLRLGFEYGYEEVFFDSTTQEPMGPIVELFKAMSKKANFTAKYAPFSNVNGKEVFKDQNKTKGFDARLFTKSSITNDEVHITTQLIEEKLSFLLTPTEPYSSYEKLAMPFDEITWTYLAAVFLYAFLLIFIINILSRKFQDFFYGRNVRTAAFNVVGTFFGIGQTKLPGSNFARILLMSFILFCLVMRTAYQGVLFEIMAIDMRRPSPKTIEELREQNYTVYVSNFNIIALNMMIPYDEMPHLEVFDSISDVLMEKMNSAGAKIAFLETNEFLWMINMLHGKGCVFLEQNLYTHVAGFGFFHTISSLN